MSPGSSRIRNVFEPMEREEVAKLWNERFSIPVEVFSGFLFFRKARSVWAISESDLPRLSYESLGMRIMSLKDRPWKPTTSALQIFGKHAARNLIHLDEHEATLFLQGESIPLTMKIQSGLESGYVVVFYRGEVLGCGLYSHGKLISQIPKSRRMADTGERVDIDDIGCL
ncbi:RNA-binding PUA-like domain of methyltransferase RsmF [uncultured archaeon]|nr:RNA-binding PUA-like domain of methyltransferase RsmF [uncultured archaeon]